MDMKKLYTLLCLVLGLFMSFLTSCGSNNDEPDVFTKRTIAIYMIASNTLSSSISADIEEIENAIHQHGTNGCRVLIYWVSKYEKPQLFEIKQGKDAATRIIHKVYDSNIKSTTKQRMKEVFDDILNISKTNEYGLMLCSHASGWASSLTGRTITKAVPLDFGDDNGSYMPLDSLADAIPANVFDFIYTDACYMGGIEVAYELKNKTKYFIGSPTEVPVDGMDYANNMSCFFADNVDLKKICENTYTKYSVQSGSSRTCTISLVDCSHLDELAQLCKQIHANVTEVTDISTIQKYKRTAPYLFYDFVQYTKMLADDEQKIALDNIMEKVVLYKAATQYIFNTLRIDSNNYSGLSTYIMGTTSSDGVNETYYKTLSWYKDVIQ